MRPLAQALASFGWMLGASLTALAGAPSGPVDPTAPQVPLNFTASAFARGLDHPTAVLVLPNGDIIAGGATGLVLLRDSTASGVADSEFPLATDLGRVLGIALRRDKLYVATADALQSCVYLVGRSRLAGPCRPITTWPEGAGTPVPGAMVFNRDETVLHVALAGGHEPAGVWALRLDGDPKHGPARRESDSAMVALALEPTRGGLWAVDAAGALLALGEASPERAASLEPGSVRGLAFYARDRYPKDYRGGLFVSEAGSGETPARIRFVPYHGARPIGEPAPFASAFQRGAPGALAATRDGALLVADEARGTLWRIEFRCGACTPDPVPPKRSR
jgi:glucose/arabinose dehydrogenase